METNSILKLTQTFIYLTVTMAFRNKFFQFFTRTDYTLRRQIILNLLGIFVLFGIILTAFLIRFNQLAEREKYLLEIAYPSQEKLESLKNYITQTNSVLQNQMIYRNALYNAERENIWKYFIQATIDSLSRYEKQWKLIEDRTEYAVLLTDIEKLKRYQRTLSRIIEEQEQEKTTYTANSNIIVTDTTLQSKISEEQVEATFDEQNAFPTTDFEATIEGVEIVKSKDFSETYIFSKNEIDAERFVVLSENAKQLYQKQIMEITEKIYIDIERLIKGRKEQIHLEKEYLNLHTQILNIASILTAVIFLLVVYWRGRAIGQKIYEKLQQIDSYLLTLAEGNLPQITYNGIDETASLLKKIEKLAQQLSYAHELAQQVSQGNFQTQLHIFKDESLLGKAFSQMQEGLRAFSEKENMRNWLNEGLTLFADILRDTANPQKLYDNLIKNIVKYVKAQYGGIYIVNENIDAVPCLELKSAYALDKKKYISQKIYLGQGLVGQCWQEKESIHLQKIPQGYVHIASGLGEEAPRALLLIPIKSGQEVYGVIEVASLQTFTGIEKDFLEVVAEDIASAIYAIKSNEKTQLLLEETNREKEDITAQKDAMQQSIALLESERQILEQRNADMATFVEAIQKAVIVAELDKYGYFISVNDKFLETTGYTHREVIGQHRSFYAPKDSDPAEFSLVWNQLSQGHYVEKNIKRIHKNGSEIWIRASFFPVLDNTGNLVKVISIGTDITSKVQQETREQESQKNASFKNTVLEHSFLVFETDRHLHIKDINEYALNNLKIDKFDYIGHHIDEIILGRWDYKALINELENRSIVEGLLVLKADEFGFRYVKMIITTVKDKRGEIESIFWVGTDITQSKVKEIQLEDKVRYLEKRLQQLESKNT